MSGWLLLGIGAAITAFDLAVGLALLRQGSDARGPELTAPPTARAGRLIMLVSPLFLIVFAALAFGAIPIDGVEPISLGAGG